MFPLTRAGPLYRTSPDRQADRQAGAQTPLSEGMPGQTTDA
jgi:hypothetical protein